MLSEKEIKEKFKLFSGGTGGIDNFLMESNDENIIERIKRIDEEPLSKVQLNQLLTLSHEAGCSDGFFEYYWLDTPTHPYNVELLPYYDPKWINGSANIVSLEHLYWGFYRIYVDSLLFFGNIRSGYQNLRYMDEENIKTFFKEKMFDTHNIKKRGLSLSLIDISKDDRYLVSEMACKSYDSNAKTESELQTTLISAWRDHIARGGADRVPVKDLLNGTYVEKNYPDSKQQLVLSADEILEDTVISEKDIINKYSKIAKAFYETREKALKNTKYYLSIRV